MTHVVSEAALAASIKRTLDHADRTLPHGEDEWITVHETCERIADDVANAWSSKPGLSFDRVRFMQRCGLA